MSGLAEAAAALLGEELRGSEPLHGGDLSQVVRLNLGSGRTAVAKSGPAARTEAVMLGAIARAGAPAPRVLAVGEGVLVLEDLGRDTGPGGAWGDLGRVLRQLHSATGDDYGWLEDHAFGPVRIPNAPASTWPDFWAERRLLAGIGEVPADLARRVERLCVRLCELLPRRPRPALLHGDLWSGNVMADGGRVTGLIDPACYHGHAEVDVAMLTLFGTPGPAFRAEYGEAEPGCEARRPIYQLWPALVHLRLFGGGYRGMVESRLSAAE